MATYFRRLRFPLRWQVGQPLDFARSVRWISLPSPNGGLVESRDVHPATSFSNFSTSASTALISASISSSWPRRLVAVEVAVEVDLVADDADLAVLLVADGSVDPSIRDVRLHLPLEERLHVLAERHVLGIAQSGSGSGLPSSSRQIAADSSRSLRASRMARLSGAASRNPSFLTAASSSGMNSARSFTSVLGNVFSMSRMPCCVSRPEGLVGCCVPRVLFLADGQVLECLGLFQSCRIAPGWPGSSAAAAVRWSLCGSRTRSTGRLRHVVPSARRRESWPCRRRSPRRASRCTECSSRAGRRRRGCRGASPQGSFAAAARPQRRR